MTYFQPGSFLDDIMLQNYNNPGIFSLNEINASWKDLGTITVELTYPLILPCSNIQTTI